MNIALVIFLSLGQYAFAGITPLPSDDKALNSNLSELALEIGRNNLRNGGTVSQNLKVSSSVHVVGDSVFGGAIKADGVTTFNAKTVHKSTADFSAATMIGPQIIQVWAHFIGTSPYTILDSVNVTSITRIATGDYRVNLSTPFSSAFFSATCTIDETASAFTGAICGEGTDGVRTGQSIRLSTFRSDSTQEDAVRVNVMAVGRR